MAVSDERVSRRSLLKKAGAGAIVLTAGGIMTSSASANQALDICIAQAVDDDVAACGACANQAPCGDGCGCVPTVNGCCFCHQGISCDGCDSVQVQPALPGRLEVRCSHVLRADRDLRAGVWRRCSSERRSAVDSGLNRRSAGRWERASFGRPSHVTLSASRSTTTCVIGTAKRSRAVSTTPRSSQLDRPSGCVEMITSSAPNVRSPSAIDCTGSASPT